MNDLKGIIEDCNKSDLVSDKVIKKIIEIIGQEEWNDLHDENSDICTTMGELIITLKRIPDLEEENAELKEKYADLEKKYFNNITDCDWCDIYCNSQLIKAKEMIKNLYEGLDKLYLSGLSAKQIAFIEQLQDKAEQFLKEIEK